MKLVKEIKENTKIKMKNNLILLAEPKPNRIIDILPCLDSGFLITQP